MLNRDRTIRGQIKAGPVQWRNLMLFVVHDYGNIRVSKLVPEEGAWPPANGEILIERDAFQVAKANIGDAVTVKTANGVEQPLVISWQRPRRGPGAGAHGEYRLRLHQPRHAGPTRRRT